MLIFISNPKYTALSKVGPPQAPLRGACGSTRPVPVPRSLHSHLLYWNSTHNRSEGLFRGLSSNHKYMALSKVGPPQSECIAHFAHTFSIGTPCVTSPRGCFEGLVRTINTWPCLQLKIPINLYMPKCTSIYTYIYTYIYIYIKKIS